MDLSNWITALSAAVSAVAAVTIACYTKSLTKSTEEQLEQLRASVKLAREEFNATHRPKIVVRPVKLDLTTRDARGSETATVSWNIVNTGTAPATIVDANATLKITAERLPALPEYDDAHTEVAHTNLLPGVSQPMVTRFQAKYDGWFDLFEAAQQESSSTIYLFGYVQYVDAARRIRETCFCRKYDHDTQRFTAADDPNYEYED